MLKMSLTILHAQSGRPALKVLCREILNVKVQQGEHSSVCSSSVLLNYIPTVCVTGVHVFLWHYPNPNVFTVCVCVHVYILGPGCSGHHAFVHTGEKEVGGGS